ARVKLFDDSTYDARLIGAVRDKDLAVLKIDAPRRMLRPLPIGESHDLRVGQSVLAIGNPFGLDYTLTTGVVSALDREIQAVSGRTIQGAIQTDAAINPGNSGGPLLDSAGRLIGINTAIVSPSGTSAGIGFAVPVDVVNRYVPQLIAYGRIIRPGIGITAVRDRVARDLGIEGVIVQTVASGGAARQAGLRQPRELRNGDVAFEVILKVGDVPTYTFDDLANALERHKVGDTVPLHVQRHVGNRVTERIVDATLQAISD
ncbi:MAG: trypsin-like peptidase domain-containing protein, partial [Phycisphaerae bacterium]